MSALSKIQWTDRTWNPVRGCSVVSPGCVNCYAMKFAHRFSGEGKPYEGLTKQTKAGPQWTGAVMTVENALLEPLSWRKPARVFVNSMSDLFHENVPNETISRVFAVMANAPQHTFQILTKRAARMRDWLEAMTRDPDAYCFAWASSFDDRRMKHLTHAPWPLANVWLGVSAEDQQRADERLPHLLQTPAAVRFVSAEPLIGPIDLRPWLHGLGWVIGGGESGAAPRPCREQWLRDMNGHCHAAGVPFFLKQVGGYPVAIPYRGSYYEWQQERFGDDWRVRLQDRKGGDPAEWPEYLRVREFPETVTVQP